MPISKSTLGLLRFALTIKCFILSLLSIIVLSITVKKYVSIKDNYGDPAGVAVGNVGILPKLSNFMIFYYVLMALSAVVVLANVSGLMGLHCNDRSKFYCYAATMVVLSGGVVCILIGFGVWKERVVDELNKLLKSYFTQIYGTKIKVPFRDELHLNPFDMLINKAQKNAPCCGNWNVAKDLSYQAYGTILFWLETTQWGANISQNLEFNSSEMVTVVPVSCCKDPIKGCNLMPYNDRFEWNDVKEGEWLQQITVKPCSDNLFLYFVEEQKTWSIIGCSLLLSLMILAAVMACVLIQCKVIEEAPQPSKTKIRDDQGKIAERPIRTEKTQPKSRVSSHAQINRISSQPSNVSVGYARVASNATLLSDDVEASPLDQRQSIQTFDPNKAE